MGKRGPAPKPTALKVLQGNPGGRALNRREPKPRTRRAKMPSHLSEKAQIEWKRIERELRSMGLLASADSDALAMYCESYVTWMDAMEQVRKLGTIVKSPSGYPIQNPYLAVANSAQKQMQQLLGQFGMTPASRTNLQAPESVSADPLDEFLKRRQARRKIQQSEEE